jgi:hypothetical protein
MNKTFKDLQIDDDFYPDFSTGSQSFVLTKISGSSAINDFKRIVSFNPDDPVIYIMRPNR